MFLLQIKNNIIPNSFKLREIENIKVSLSITKQNSTHFKKLDNNQSFVFKKPNLKDNTMFVSYIIGVTVLPKSVVFYVSDIKKKLLFSIKSGQLGLKGNQKKRKPTVFIQLLRYFFKQQLFQNVINKPVSVHFKNVDYSSLKTIVAFLTKKNLVIVAIKNFNNTPHNGCRPRKIKRKKRRKLFFNSYK